MSNYSGAAHIALLALAIQRTTGPILELGIGIGSTPLVHLLGAQQGRYVVSIDNNAEWLQQYSHLSCPTHRFVCADYAEVEEIETKQWDVVLLDHGDAPGRGRDLRRLKANPFVGWIIVHDVEGAGYEYEPTLSEFKYRTDVHEWTPWTTVVSDKEAFVVKP